MLSFDKCLDLQIMFGEMFEKCKNGYELDQLVDLLTSIVENTGEEIREERGGGNSDSVK